MARVTVQYDATSGSDSYSGAGGTAVTGTNGDISGTTITLNETKDLSAFAAGDVVYYAGNSGDRHLFEIASFTGGAATCTAIVTVESATAARTASNWAVGGKRQTLQADTSRRDFSDGDVDWTFDLGAGTYTLGGQIGAAPSSTKTQMMKIKGAGSGSTTLSLNHNNEIWTDGAVHFAGLTISLDGTLTPTTSTALLRPSNNDSHTLVFENCVVDGLQNVVEIFWSVLVVGFGTEFKNLGNTIGLSGSHELKVNLYGCSVHDNGSHGVRCENENASSNLSALGNIIHNCIIYDNGGDGINVPDAGEGGISIVGNTIHGNTGDGLQIDAQGEYGVVVVANNLFTNNGGYGVRGFSGFSDGPYVVDYNGYGGGASANTSGTHTNFVSGANDVTLSADPYTSESTDDYTLNATSGGGADLTGTGFPGIIPVS